MDTFTDRKLPHDFLRLLKSLERSYLKADDPIRQSGFGGGAVRWRREREAILDAVEADGDFLDIGCANGYLLECLAAWAEERGINLIPYGLDAGPGLIALAKRRLPQYSGHFFVGNAWDWKPPRKFRYVYSLHDCVPEDFLGEYIRRLLSRMVAEGGRLIIGAYGSRGKEKPPFDIDAFLKSQKIPPAGRSAIGNPPAARLAWIDKK
jgi:SAM-dependent methyltransferase